MKKLGCLTSISFLLFLLAPGLMVLFLLVGGESKHSKASASSVNLIDGVTYVDHWTDGDPYTHNLLAHRYGITAEQIDGFLDTTGIPYDKKRLNGKLLLEWEKASGLDVRAIVAIAQMESSFGTAGVATLPGANMFGYGAFDSNPENASNYNDQTAVTALTKVTIIGNKNQTFKIQDEKAQRYANGTLNASTEGGVYYTDTSGSGHHRADVMARLDKYIDEHGGTPKAPASKAKKPTGNNSVTMDGVPPGYALSSKIDTAGYSSATYPWGQCTWFAFNRGAQVGVTFDPYMGNGGDWASKPGFTVTHTPTQHSALSFPAGVYGADPTYGHVAFVEQVKSDGSVLISESNVQGLGVISYRVIPAEDAKAMNYVIGH